MRNDPTDPEALEAAEVEREMALAQVVDLCRRYRFDVAMLTRHLAVQPRRELAEYGDDFF